MIKKNHGETAQIDSRLEHVDREDILNLLLRVSALETAIYTLQRQNKVLLEAMGRAILEANQIK